MCNSRKRYYTYVFLTFLLLLSGFDLYSQDRAFFYSNVYAKVLTRKVGDAYSIEKILDLNFGNIVIASTSGTMTINPQNNFPSYTGGVSPLPSERTRAEFLVKGKANMYFSVSINTSSITLQNTGNSGQTLTLSLSNYTTGRFNSTGNGYLYIGGTLDIGANQPSGSYQGTFTVTLNNN
jgi:hypothetical protein